jgi:hypothetical protein
MNLFIKEDLKKINNLLKSYLSLRFEKMRIPLALVNLVKVTKK